jgi:GrpB-like predicted nucleotidyltransferase (UPF0157 family)
MNLPAREVVIVDYDYRWPALFEAERARLLAAAPAAVISVDHVGSTSVPGLAAKPIIDVLVTLHRFLNDDEIAALCLPGHEYRGIDDDIQRQYFSKRTPPAFHLHCYLPDNPEAARLLLFRDYLRAHPETAQAYAALKRDLAAKYRFQRETYQDAKTAFVRHVEAEAELTAQARLAQLSAVQFTATAEPPG